MAGPDVPEVPDSAESAKQAGRSVYRSFIDTVLTGVVVIIPLVITLWVLQAAFGFISNALRPFISGTRPNPRPLRSVRKPTLAAGRHALQSR